MTDNIPPPKKNTHSTTDLDGIAKVVTDLHIAHRNLSIYPPTHEQVKQSVGKAHQGLTGFLEHDEILTLAVLQDGLMVEETLLTTNPQICKEFANILKRYQIATLSFEPDLDEMELVRFLLLIGAEKRDIAEQGGIESAAEDCNLSSITIAAVDYSKLHLTEEREIQRSDGQDRKTSVWQQYVTHMINAQLAEGGKSGSELQEVLDPDQLAGLLNQNQLDVRTALQQYDEMLAEVTQHQDIDVQIHEGLQHFNDMIKELNPDLRSQFLSATLKGCNEFKSEDGVNRFMDGMGADLIVQMIRQANAQDREISPSLMAFLKKMGHLGTPMEPSASETDTVKGELSSAHVSALLEHEQYDHYVDEEYSILLDNLVVDDQSKADPSEPQSLSQELANSLSLSNINCHVGKAMAGLMTHSGDSDDYRSWARQLSYILGELLDTHSYDCLSETLAFIVKERDDPDQEKAKVADIVWNHFNSPEFVAKAVEQVMKSNGERAGQGLGFLLELGEPAVVEILDLLKSGETEIERKKLIGSLDKFGILAAREAVERIGDAKLKYLRMMIQIVRRLGDNQSAEQLRSLLMHDDVDIRMEALGTLLRFNNKWGLIRLRELINEPWSDITQKSIELAGAYKVKDVVPILISFVQRRGDAQRQEEALRALGNIGDERAIPVLDKMVRRRWSMSKKHRLNLNRVIFESLEGYESSVITDLLHFGLKQKDEYIQRLCEEMLRKIRLTSA